MRVDRSSPNRRSRRRFSDTLRVAETSEAPSLTARVAGLCISV